MQLSIRHVTRYTYEPEARGLALRLKLFPARATSQTPASWQVTVEGKSVPPLVTDATGDGVALWHCHGATGGAEIVAEGTIETEDKAGVVGGLSDMTAPAVWLRSTALTEPDESLRELAAKTSGETVIDRLHELSEAVYEAVDYRQGVTDATTTAAEALALGAGVCQDQTHVFISAARSLDIPARYVVGYLLNSAIEDAVAPESETHAWAEAHVPGLGWVGFDPTHQLCPTDAYVRLCCGLDAADAAPLRGSVVGETEETLDVELAITQAQSQRQS